MIRVALVRGAYLNNFEGQNYIFENDISITGIASQKSIHQNLPFPVKRLWSLTDINIFPQKLFKFVTNRLFGDGQILFGLENIVNNFDIFHTADPHYYYSYQLAKLRAQGIIKNLIVTSWETIPFNNETVKIKKQHKYFVLKHADYFICYTNKARDVLIKEGVDERKISVVPLGVKFTDQEITKDPPEKNSFNLLFVGRLVEEKGILDVIEVFMKAKKIFTEKNINLSLRIVGEGPLRNYLQHIIKTENLSKSIIIDHKRYEEMNQVYWETDICIFPSKHTKTWEEQYGMVFIEAMMAGKPIITYNTGAIREVVGNAAIIHKEHDKEGILQNLLNLINDSQWRYDLSVKARKRATEFFDSSKTAAEIGTIYKRIYENSFRDHLNQK